MTTGATLVTTSLLSASGFVAGAMLPPQPQGEPIPWKDISNGGAAALLLVALWFFLRFLREERKERAEERANDRKHVETLVGNCTEVTAKLGQDFSQTTTQLMAAVREDSQSARRELHDLVRDLKRPT